MQAPALAAHVVAHVDRFLDVAAGLGADLAHLARHQVGQLGLVLAQELGEAEEDVAALGRRDEAPVLEGRLGRRDGAVDVGGGRAREGAEHLAGRGDRSTRRSRRPAASTHSPPMEFLKLGAAVAMAAILDRDYAAGRSLSANVPGMRARRRSRSSRFCVELVTVAPAAPVGARAAVDDDGHAGIVRVVGDELVVQLRLELAAG